jgi:hypothetical protein
MRSGSGGGIVGAGVGDDQGVSSTTDSVGGVAGGAAQAEITRQTSKGMNPGFMRKIISATCLCSNWESNLRVINKNYENNY